MGSRPRILPSLDLIFARRFPSATEADLLLTAPHLSLPHFIRTRESRNERRTAKNYFCGQPKRLRRNYVTFTVVRKHEECRISQISQMYIYVTHTRTHTHEGATGAEKTKRDAPAAGVVIAIFVSSGVSSFSHRAFPPPPFCPLRLHLFSWGGRVGAGEEGFPSNASRNALGASHGARCSLLRCKHYHWFPDDPGTRGYLLSHSLSSSFSSFYSSSSTLALSFLSTLPSAILRRHSIFSLGVIADPSFRPLHSVTAR